MDFKKLNRRITIVTPGAKTADNIGGWTEAAATNSDTWCSATPLSMYETLRNGMPTGTRSFKFGFRYNSALGISQGNDLIYEGKTYRISSVREIKEQDEIEVIASSDE